MAREMTRRFFFFIFFLSQCNWTLALSIRLFFTRVTRVREPNFRRHEFYETCVVRVVAATRQRGRVGATGATATSTIAV